MFQEMTQEVDQKKLTSSVHERTKCECQVFLLLSENKSDEMFYDFRNVGRFSLLKVLEMVRKSEHGR